VPSSFSQQVAKGRDGPLQTQMKSLLEIRQQAREKHITKQTVYTGDNVDTTAAMINRRKSYSSTIHGKATN